jgi:hypothetical protein
MHLLRPDADRALQMLYLYITAVLCSELGILLHAVQMLSNHFHEVVTDTRGVLPKFLQERNRLFALGIQVHRNWKEPVFSRTNPSCIELPTNEAILAKIGYTLANCVAAGLAATPGEWPGVTVTADDIGKTIIEVARPSFFFDPSNSRWPETAKIAITVPPTIAAAHDTLALARDVIRKAIECAVGSALDEASEKGFVTHDPARATESNVRAHTKAPASGGGGRTFASVGDKAAAARAIAERRAFRRSYRSALERVREGLAQTPFPFGTWRYCRELHFPMLAAA